MRNGVIFLSIVFFMYSCGGKNSGGNILPTARMQEVMWDIFLADAFTQKYLKTDSSKADLTKNAALQQKIFELHKITREDFYTSYAYYNSHPDIMRVMLDSITVRAERERSSLMQQRYSGERSPLLRGTVNIDSIRKTRMVKE